MGTELPLQASSLPKIGASEASPQGRRCSITKSLRLIRRLMATTLMARLRSSRPSKMVRILRIALGAGPAGDGTSREARACNRGWELGLVVVKSAGNAGPGSSSLTTPADAEGVIVVGATDRKGKAVQGYSSRGPAGTRERPHLVAPGGSDSSGIETSRPGGGFGSAGAGTSFAAPQISGLAALLLDEDPNLLPDAVRTALIAKCKRFPTGDGNLQGAGLIKVR